MGGTELQQIYQQLFNAEVNLAKTEYVEVFSGRSDSSYYLGNSAKLSRNSAFRTLEKILSQEELTIAKLAGLLEVAKKHINIHKNPMVDSFLSIKNTDLWKKGLSLIREKALLLLQNQITPCFSKTLPPKRKQVESIRAQLNLYKRLTLFKAHVDNWFTPDKTNAVKYIARECNALDRLELSCNNSR